MLHGRCAQQIGRLEERMKALERELDDHRQQAEQLARFDERIKALESQLSELTSRLATQQQANWLNRARWLQLLVNGLFILAGSVAGALILAGVF